jgi:hypothetical protein
LCWTGFATPFVTLNIAYRSGYLKRHGRGCKPRPAQKRHGRGCKPRPAQIDFIKILCWTGFATPSVTLNIAYRSGYLKRHGRGCKPRPAQDSSQSLSLYVLHLAGHGLISEDDPLSASLVMGDHEKLDARTILHSPLRAQVVFDPLGLVSAFFMRGAQCLCVCFIRLG